MAARNEYKKIASGISSMERDVSHFAGDLIRLAREASEYRDLHPSFALNFGEIVGIVRSSGDLLKMANERFNTMLQHDGFPDEKLFKYAGKQQQNAGNNGE